MTLRDDLEKLDAAVADGRHYSFRQSIWREMLDVLDAVDALGVAIADAGYVWSPEMRTAYELASGTEVVK